MEPFFPMPDDPPELPPPPPVPGCYTSLLEESQARGRRLTELLALVASLKARTESVLRDQRADLDQLRNELRERDHTARTAQQRLGCVYAMLVHLVATCEDVRDENGWGGRVSEFNDRIDEARELISAARPYLK